MRPKHFLSFALLVSACTLFSATATAQSDSCCAKPDSLKVTVLTDSSFCVSWKIRDSSNCADTLKAGVVQWKIFGTSGWETKVIKYSAGQWYATFCDSARPCTKYSWRVKNACKTRNGDTTYSAYVNGPSFPTLGCDTSKPAGKYALNVQASPNPVHGMVLISGQYERNTMLTVSILSSKGYLVLTKQVLPSAGKFSTQINLANFEKGLYFINVSDGATVRKLTILKE